MAMGCVPSLYTSPPPAAAGRAGEGSPAWTVGGRRRVCMFSQRTGFTSRYRGVVSRMGPSAWEKRGGRDARLFVSLTTFPANRQRSKPTHQNTDSQRARWTRQCNYTISFSSLFKSGGLGRKTLPPSAPVVVRCEQHPNLINYAKQKRPKQ